MRGGEKGEERKKKGRGSEEGRDGERRKRGRVGSGGVTLFQKVGGTNFRRRRGGWAGGGVWGAQRPLLRKFFITYSRKAHFGGYLMHSDVLIL